MLFSERDWDSEEFRASAALYRAWPAAPKRANMMA